MPPVQTEVAQIIVMLWGLVEHLIMAWKRKGEKFPMPR
jgi:hypothetical protein